MVVSSELFLKDESDIVNQLFEEGLEYFHLRKPAASEEEISFFINGISSNFRRKISLHSHHHLASSFGIERLHMKEGFRISLGENLVEVITNSEYKFSTSLHSIEDLEILPNQFEYAFLSPVFDSISKANYQGFAKSDFKLADEWKRTRIIGLGGIEGSNINQLKDMNFDGAAVLGYIWRRPKLAVKNFIKLRRNAE